MMEKTVKVIALNELAVLEEGGKDDGDLYK